MVLIGACQRQQVMILQHYFYMPSILSGTVIRHLTFMSPSLLSLSSFYPPYKRNSFIRIYWLELLIEFQIKCCFVCLWVQIICYSMCLHDAPWPSCSSWTEAPAQSPPGHLAWITWIKPSQMSVLCYFSGMCLEKWKALYFLTDVQIRANPFENGLFFNSKVPSAEFDSGIYPYVYCTLVTVCILDLSVQLHHSTGWTVL